MIVIAPSWFLSVNYLLNLGMFVCENLFFVADLTMHLQMSLTGQKSHYPPASHHAIHL